MARFYDALTPELIAFATAQRLFFTASGTSEGRVNLSPKGTDSFRVLDPKTACYLDLTGSGTETAAHARADGRLTLMFCSFDESPLILRLYGRSRVVLMGDTEWDMLRPRFPSLQGARQIICLAIDSVQTSCGYAVPRYEYLGERETYPRWAEKKGAAGLRDYQRTRNVTSIDGLPTGLIVPDDNEPPLQSR